MLSGDGKENRPKISLSVNRRKNNFACGAHFVEHNSLPLSCTTTSRNFQKLFTYTFYGGTVVSFPVHFFFSLPFIFTLVAATTSCQRTWDTVPYFSINGLSMILCLWSPSTPHKSCWQYRTMLKTLRNNFKPDGEGRSVLYLTDLWLVAI